VGQAEALGPYGITLCVSEVGLGRSGKVNEPSHDEVAVRLLRCGSGEEELRHLRTG